MSDPKSPEPEFVLADAAYRLNAASTRLGDSLGAMDGIPHKVSNAVQAEILPALEAIHAFCEQAGQIARRPALTDLQVENYLVPAAIVAFRVRSMTYAALFGGGLLILGGCLGALVEYGRMEARTIIAEPGATPAAH